MLRPKVPTNPAPTGIVTPLNTEPTAVVQHTPAPTPVAPAPAAPVLSRPSVQLTPGALVALVGGGTAVVLVVGAVLVSMLLAVAITAASLAICALVIRTLINAQHQR
ncbi:SpdD-like protein [Streptomyces sp. NPDC051776]|uniref:SpdD-like protein n=1 Tax=Streptomyces sp. NPDC051776 TaxID=3155414 RepID=UPI0034361999